jgi:hypothetical protein
MAEQDNQHKEVGKDLPAIVRRLSTCGADDVSSQLRRLQGSQDHAVAFATSLLLSSLQVNAPYPPWFDTAFELLGASRSEVATAFLKQAALHATLANVRLEALRRLKGRTLGKESLDRVHGYAAEGCADKLLSFQGRSVAPHDFQVAALGVLSDSTSRAETSRHVVWTLLESILSERAAGTSVYPAALACMAEMVDASFVSQVLHKAEGHQPVGSKLHLIALLSKLGAEDLAEHAERTLKLILVTLTSCPQDQTIPQGVIDIAANLQPSEFLRKLASSFLQERLDTPRGKLIASVMNAYHEADDVLREIALQCAKVPGNVHRESACLRALKRCAQAQGEKILAEMCTCQTQALWVLREPENCLAVFESQERLWETALSAAKNLDENQASILSLILMASALPHLDEHRAKWEMEQLAKRMVVGERSWSGETCGEYFEASNKHGLWAKWGGLVTHVMGPEAPPQLANLLKPILARDDALAQRIVEMVVAEAQRRADADSAYPAQSTATTVVEQLLVERHTAQIEKLIQLGLRRQDGRLSRYALRLSRLAGRGFPAFAQKLLSEPLAAEDKVLVIDELARTGTAEAVDALCVGTKDVSEEQVRLRCAALNAIAMVLEPSPPIRLQAEKKCMSAVHERFARDKLDVRMAAYDACRRIVSFDSIAPLRQRLTTEAEQSGRGRIEQALAAIRQRLDEEQPPLSDVARTLSWLTHAHDLGDAQLVARVETYLSSPHENEEVLLRALECLAAFRDKRGIQIAKAFLSSTSPVGRIRTAAERAIAVLRGRKDLTLLESLPFLVGEGSELLSPERHNYEKLFGEERCDTLAQMLQGCEDHHRMEQRNDFVTEADAIGHVLVKQIYESNYSSMKLSQQEGAAFATRKYDNLLNRTEFKNTYPCVHTRLHHLHDLRREALGPHAEEEDGRPKPGIRDQATADRARALLREAFNLVVQALEESEPAGG